RGIRGALIPSRLSERFATVQTRQVGSEISRSGATHWPFPVTTENAHLLLADALRNGSENISARSIGTVLANDERFARLITGRRAFISRHFDDRSRYRYWFYSSCLLPIRTPAHPERRVLQEDRHRGDLWVV